MIVGSKVCFPLGEKLDVRLSHYFATPFVDPVLSTHLTHKATTPITLRERDPTIGAAIRAMPSKDLIIRVHKTTGSYRFAIYFFE